MMADLSAVDSTATRCREAAVLESPRRALGAPHDDPDLARPYGTWRSQSHVRPRGT